MVVCKQRCLNEEKAVRLSTLDVIFQYKLCKECKFKKITDQGYCYCCGLHYRSRLRTTEGRQRISRIREIMIEKKKILLAQKAEQQEQDQENGKIH